MIALAGTAPIARSTPRRGAEPCGSIGLGASYVPGGDATVMHRSAPFVGNIVTSDPVRYARTEAVLEAEPDAGIGSPTVAWADAAFRAMARNRRAGLSRRRSASRC